MSIELPRRKKTEVVLSILNYIVSREKDFVFKPYDSFYFGVPFSDTDIFIYSSMKKNNIIVCFMKDSCKFVLSISSFLKLFFKYEISIPCNNEHIKLITIKDDIQKDIYNKLRYKDKVNLIETINKSFV